MSHNILSLFYNNLELCKKIAHHRLYKLTLVAVFSSSFWTNIVLVQLRIAQRTKTCLSCSSLTLFFCGGVYKTSKYEQYENQNKLKINE